MAIDTSALKKFLETFGPVVEALPTVMDAVNKQNSIDKEIKRQTKELEKLQAAMDSVVAEAEAKVVEANKMAESVLATRTATQGAIADDKREAAKKAREAEAKANDKLKAIEEKTATAEKQLKAVDADLKARLKLAETEFNTRKEVMDAEIAELEKRQASAERSLATLLKKLGG